MHSIDVRHRQLRVGLEYMPPPDDGIDVIDLKKDDLKKMLTTSTGIGKIIGRSLGLPKKYVEEIIRLSSIDRAKPSNEISDTEFEALFDVIKTTISNVVNGEHDPTIITDSEEPDVFPIRFSDDNTKAEEVSSFNEGLDIIFTEQILQKGKSLYGKEAEKRISELQNRLEEQQNAIKVVEEKSKSIADVANVLFSIQSEGNSKINDPQVIEALKNHNTELIMEKGLPILKVGDAKVKIERDASLPSIASVLFDESKKQKGAIGSIEKLIKKTDDQLQKTIEKGEIARGSVSFSDIRKKSWYERYRWFLTSDGILAVGGRDSSSNSALIRKHMENDDKIFHAEINGSPFFILKDRSETLMPLSLEEAAHATVCFSRAWQTSAHGLNSFWVKPDQVKKAAPSGQSMGKGSFMIYGTRNFIKVSTLKLAVGIMMEDEKFLLVCGPPEPIKRKCVCYAIIEPGGSSISDVAKKIRAEFNKTDDKFQKLFVIDDYVRALPTGASKIIDSGIQNLI